MPSTFHEPQPPAPAGSTAAYCGRCGWLRPAWVPKTSGLTAGLTAVCLDCGATLSLATDSAFTPQPENTPFGSTAALFVATQPAAADDVLFEQLARPGGPAFAPVHSQGLRRMAPLWREHWRQLRRWSWLELWWGALLPVLVFGLVASHLYQQGRTVVNGLAWPVFVTAYPLFMLMLWRAWNNSRAEGWLREQFQHWRRSLPAGLGAAEFAAALETVAADETFAMQFEGLWKINNTGDPVSAPGEVAPPDRNAAIATLKAEILACRQIPPAMTPEPTPAPAVLETSPELPVESIPIPAVPVIPVMPVLPPPRQSPPGPGDLRGHAHACAQLLQPNLPPAAGSASRRRLRQACGVSALAITIILLAMTAANLQRDVELFLANTSDEALDLYVDGKRKREIAPHWVEHFYIADAGKHVIELRAGNGERRWRRTLEFKRGCYALNPSQGAWQFVWHEFQPEPGGAQHRSTVLPGRPVQGVVKLPASPDWGPNDLVDDSSPGTTVETRRTWLELRQVADDPALDDGPMTPARRGVGPEFEVEPNGDLAF